PERPGDHSPAQRGVPGLGLSFSGAAGGAGTRTPISRRNGSRRNGSRRKGPEMRLNRRRFLRGVSLATGAVLRVGLPPLEAMFNTNGTAYAADAGKGDPI